MTERTADVAAMPSRSNSQEEKSNEDCERRSVQASGMYLPDHDGQILQHHMRISGNDAGHGLPVQAHGMQGKQTFTGFVGV